MLREMREFDQALIVKKLTGLGCQLKSMRLKNSFTALVNSRGAFSTDLSFK